MTESRILVGDAATVLATLPDEHFNCVVTSPPFWGLRDYGTGEWTGGDPACSHRSSGRSRQIPHGDGDRKRDPYAEGQVERDVGHPYAGTCGRCGAVRVDQQIGLEETMGEWLDRLLAVFAQVRRVLRSDGCMWVEIGDAHAGKVPGNHRPDHTHGRFTGTRGGQAASKASRMLARRRFEGVKLKDLLCLPFELALALRAQGWWLRQTIIWEKPTCTPETVRDRPSTSHSYVFLLSKSMRYAYDRDAISERTTGGAHPRGSGKGGKGSTLALPMSHRGVPKQNASFSSAVTALVDRRNKRSVWRIQSEPSAWKHCAAFPRKLVEPCVLAGCPAGGRVLDPFSGSGTVGVVCRALRRDFTGIELNAETAAFSENRIRHVTAGLPIGVSA